MAKQFDIGQPVWTFEVELTCNEDGSYFVRMLKGKVKARYVWLKNGPYEVVIDGKANPCVVEEDCLAPTREAAIAAAKRWLDRQRMSMEHIADQLERFV